MGDSVALQRFRASCLALAAVGGACLLVLALGGDPVLLVPIAIIGLAFGVVQNSSTRW